MTRPVLTITRDGIDTKVMRRLVPIYGWLRDRTGWSSLRLAKASIVGFCALLIWRMLIDITQAKGFPILTPIFTMWWGVFGWQWELADLRRLEPMHDKVANGDLTFSMTDMRACNNVVRHRLMIGAWASVLILVNVAADVARARWGRLAIDLSWYLPWVLWFTGFYAATMFMDGGTPIRDRVKAWARRLAFRPRLADIKA